MTRGDTAIAIRRASYPRRGGVKPLLLYLLFALGVLLLFGYLLFPSGEIVRQAAAIVHRMDPDLDLQVDGAGPTMPPGVLFKQVSLNTAGRTVLSLPWLKLQPDLKRLLGVGGQYEFRAEGHGGRLSGRIQPPSDSAARLRMEIEFESLDLQTVPLVRLLNPSLRANLQGSLSFADRFPQAMSGSGKLRFSGLFLQLAEPFLNLKQVTFDRIEAVIRFSPPVIEVVEAQLIGDQFSGRCSGRMIALQPLETTRLELQATLVPSPAYRGLFPGQSNVGVRVTGTLAQPQLQLQ